MASTIAQPTLPKLDLVTYKEAKALFAETGHAVSESTMRRWMKEGGRVTVRMAGGVYVSFSDLLVAHGDWVAAAATIP
ncbi:hypothetical protein XF35_39125 [Streptomyces platensis subsp. clarensis]|uniref:Excisionase n=1 Tax=Streptomyces showdoensis TaxID=68268 RepID=A0A2P2GKQ1_STREW|nr:hypothetical protein [Streptomyces showdoensis]KKZ72094.1 hypothetical protein VO63_20160 [Streptomyces showdoensis]MCW7991071.1 hypothetical protein [Streptomyces platensis subsp. clarensis]